MLVASCNTPSTNKERERRSKAPQREQPNIPGEVGRDSSGHNDGTLNSTSTKNWSQEGGSQGAKLPKITLQSFDAGAQLKDQPWRRKLFMLIEEPAMHPIALLVFYAYLIVTISSVPSAILLTVEDLSATAERTLKGLEMFINILFSIDVLIRLSVAPVPYMLFKNMYFWIDVAAIVPFYIVTVPQLDQERHPGLELLVLMVPIFRLLKVTRYSSGWRLLMLSIQRVIPPLAVPAFLALIMIVCSSSTLFWIEKHTAATADVRAFLNVPHTMWFAVVTISTVGYGDPCPNTPLGQMATCLLILLGVCYMAMPLAIVGSTFMEVWESRDKLLMRMKVQEKLAITGIGKQQLEELFVAFDTDGSGSMTRAEFIQLLLTFRLGMTRTQMCNLFKNIDDNNSGEVCFQEFADFLFPEMDIDDDRGQKHLGEMRPSYSNPQHVTPPTQVKLEAIEKRIENLEGLIGELVTEQRRLLQRFST